MASTPRGDQSELCTICEDACISPSNPKFNEKQIIVSLAMVPYFVTKFTGPVHAIQLETLKATWAFLSSPRVIELIGVV